MKFRLKSNSEFQREFMMTKLTKNKEKLSIKNKKQKKSY